MKIRSVLSFLTMGALMGKEAHAAAIERILAPRHPSHEEKKSSPRPKSHQRHFGGKHYRGSHAPVCPKCRVTLSHGRCLNRMCSRMDGKVA